MWFFAVLLSWGDQTQAQSVGFSPRPAFVVEAQAPLPNPTRMREIDGGWYDLLYDTQVRIDGPVETTYLHRIYKIVDRSALEDAAQIKITFDPSYERLWLHRLRIIRNGRPIDVAASAEIEILRRENELHDGILNGVRTALIRLPDVRVGDIVDGEWSWRSQPPLWPGQYFGSFQLGWSVPVALTRYRLDLPAGTPLRMSRFRGAEPARFTRIGQRDQYQWEAHDPDLVAEDEETPTWHNPWPRVSLSTMRNWAEVVRWALPLYILSDDFPDAWQAEAAAIERQGGSDAVKAVKALRLVQDKIRYTSMSIGPGSFRPRSPADVVRQGWGDCKDKVQLLVTLLRRLRIPAWPALTDADEGVMLDREDPSPTSFDHVIVQMKIAGRSYWVDPTISHQGGNLEEMAPLPYHRALPVRPGQTRLEAIPLPQLAAPDRVATEVYRLGSDGITLDVETIFTGGQADATRQRFAEGSVARTEAEYLRYYSDKYPGLKIKLPLRVRDARNRNRLVTYESYLLPPDVYADGKLFDKFPVAAGLVSDIYTYPRGDRRVHPLGLSFPINRLHKIVFVTPGYTVSPPEDVRIQGKVFDYRLDTRRDGDTLALSFSIIGKSALVMPADFEQFRKDADEVASNNSWNLSISEGEAWNALDSIFLCFAAASLVLLGFGLKHAHRYKDHRPPDELFYPVPIGKFVLLSVSTLQLYAAYWMWRNWRWVRLSGEDIWAFWRSVFMVFWLYPLFARANSTATRPLATGIGAISAILYFSWSAASNAYDNLSSGFHVMGFLTHVAVVFMIPTLVVVNRSNDAARVRANGKIGWLGISSVLIGIPTLILLEFI